MTFPEPSHFLLVLGGEGSSWDYMGIRENVKQQTRTENPYSYQIGLILVLKSKSPIDTFLFQEKHTHPHHLFAFKSIYLVIVI